MKSPIYAARWSPCSLRIALAGGDIYKSADYTADLSCKIYDVEHNNLLRLASYSEEAVDSVDNVCWYVTLHSYDPLTLVLL